jgi:hypothetical protein
LSEPLDKLREVNAVQQADGNWNYDPYMHGMANGLELALAIMEGREPAYKEAPARRLADAPAPIPMLLFCPVCHAQHVDAPEPENDWTNPPHKSHKCHSCAAVWRPADVPTTGVASIGTRGERDTWPAAPAGAEGAEG